MKKLFYLTVFSLLSLFTNAQILAGDFYYETTATDKYDIYLRLVRNCSKTSLSSTQTIRVTVPGDFQNVTLTRISIKNVTGACGVGACSPANTTGSTYGFEEHIYKASVDLTQSPFGGSTWSNACDLWFAFQTSDRSSDITTFKTGAGFYTSAKVDKCLASSNKSPRFNGKQARVVCCTQALHVYGQNTDADGDSLSYEMIPTPIHQSANVTYLNSNLCSKPFSGTMPFTPYLSFPCGPHIPKPTYDPPIGFYFDKDDAEIVFTPNECNERSVVTYKVYEWRKIGGVYKQIGESYREIYMRVESCTANNPPVFTSKNTYYAIPNNLISFDVVVKDDPVIPPPPATPPPADTVSISWDSGISGASFTVVDTSRLPVGKFSWTPGCAKAQASPYSFIVYATDSNCPVAGESSQKIDIYVLQDIKGILGPDRITCGNTIKPVVLRPNVIGATYKWSDNSTADSLAVTQPGTYWVEITSTNCSFSSRDTIIIDTTGIITSNLYNRVGECLPFTTTLGNNYNHSTFVWNTGPTTPTITVDSFGYYEVTISSAACGTKKQGFTVFSDTLKVNLGQDILTCDTAGIKLDGYHDNNAVSYLWNTNEKTSSIIPDSCGTYWVKLSHSSCGTISDTITLTKDSGLANLGADITLCTPAKGILTPNKKYKNSSYLWSTMAGGDSITVVKKGDYWLNVINPVCGTFSDTANVNVLTKPNVNLGPNKGVACKKVNEILMIPDFGSPTTIEWSTGEKGVRDIKVTEEGIYGVVVTNICGTASDSVELIDTVKFNFSLGPDITYCNENFVSLSGNFTHLPDEYLWSNNETTSSINIFNEEDTTATGTFWLQAKRCKKTVKDTINITFKYTPVPDIGDDHVTDTPFVETLDAGVMGDSYLWSTGDTTRSIEIKTVGKYTVSVTNECGTGYDTITLYYIGIPKITLLADDIKLYPNPSKGNFNIKFDNIKSRNLSLVITSADGKQVYERQLNNVKGANLNEQFSLGNLAKGVYYINITADEGTYTFKLLLE